MAKSAGTTNGKAPTKSQVLTNIADKTELSRKQVASVFDALGEEIKNSLGKRGPGVFTVPGLMKITVKNKAAVPAGRRMDPFTKQERDFPAKPASRAVRVRPLRGLKDMVK
jgi:nucleoid DNA-binding protein